MRRFERGEIEMKLVIGVMALIAGLAWAVPMLFLGRQQVERAADLTGASSDAGASASVAPTDPIGRADDVSAKATLTTAMQGAQTFFASSGTYEGVESQLAAFDPSIHVGSSPAPGVVAVRGVTASSVVLVTADARGNALCEAADGTSVTYGRTDARTALQCRGGW